MNQADKATEWYWLRVNSESIEIYKAKNYPVATVNHDIRDKAECESYAQTIVTAVNEREALLAVAEAARQWVKREDLAWVEIQTKYGVCKDSKPIPEMETLRQALAALDKTKEGK